MTVLLGVVVVVGGIFLGMYLWEKKRTKRMALAAADMGMQFYATGDDALIGELAISQHYCPVKSRIVSTVSGKWCLETCLLGSLEAVKQGFSRKG
jgi:hypothetical protein